MSNPLDRYLQLGIEESLAIPSRYPLACKDLAFILRSAYKKFPKPLQSRIFHHVITAFCLLPDMQRKDAEAAVNLLFQSVEAVLPKQKKNQAVTHFKNAKVALKRRIKTQQKETGSAELPQDVLIHIFSSLDLQSLLSASQVCWVWHSAASDNHLWRIQYDNVFGNTEVYSKLQHKTPLKSRRLSLVKNSISEGIDWRKSLRRAQTGIPSKFTSHWGYCEHCSSIVWLNNLRCSNGQVVLKSETHQAEPVKLTAVVDYIVEGGCLLDSSSSESECDSSDNDGNSLETVSRLWAYPTF